MAKAPSRKRVARKAARLRKRRLFHEPVLTPVGELKPHPRNYQGHPPSQRAHIRASIEANGFYRNVVAAKDGTLLAGHGVWETASVDMGLAEIPVIHLPIAPDSPRALRILAGDNLIANLADRKDRVLTEVLDEIRVADNLGLLGTGLDDAMLASLLVATRTADELPSWAGAGMPAYTAGGTLRVVVQFKDEAARKDFVRAAGLPDDQRSRKGTVDSYRWAP